MGKKTMPRPQPGHLHCRTGKELRNLQWFPICLSGSNLPYRNSKWVFLCLINGGRSASLQVVSAKQHKAKAFWRSVVTGHTNPSSPAEGTHYLSLVLPQYKSPTGCGTHRSHRHVGHASRQRDVAARSTSSYWRQNKIQCIPTLETPRQFPGLI